MIIFIQSQNDERFPISADETWSIEDVKKYIASSRNIPVQNQILIHLGRILENDKRISDYNIFDDHVIHLVKILSQDPTNQSLNWDFGKYRSKIKITIDENRPSSQSAYLSTLVDDPSSVLNLDRVFFTETLGFHLRQK